MIDDGQVKILNEFLLDINSLEKLNKYIDNVNIFKILKTNKYEIRHSNFLAWLLNPYENHKLNDKFLRLFVAEFLKGNREVDKMGEWLLLDMSNGVVSREAWYKNKKDYLDIVIEFPNEKKVIAIENKVFSKENQKDDGAQTTIYKEKLKDTFLGYDMLLIYLTPLGDSPADEDWGSMTYAQIRDIIQKAIDDYVEDQYIKLLLENYIEILGDGIVENRELTKICDEIYKKHQKALDLIFANKTDGASVVARFMKEALSEIDEEQGNIIYQEKFDSGVTYVRFATKFLNSLLGEYDEGVSAWPQNSKQRYFYEFWVRELKNEGKQKLKLNLVLSLKDLQAGDEVLDKIKKICVTLGSKRKLGVGTTIANSEKYIILDNAIQQVEENRNNEEFKQEVKNKIKDIIEKIEHKIGVVFREK